MQAMLNVLGWSRQLEHLVRQRALFRIFSFCCHRKQGSSNVDFNNGTICFDHGFITSPF
jgi:hypothetical protein